MSQSAHDVARTIRRKFFQTSIRKNKRFVPAAVTPLEERATPDISGQLFRDNNFDGAFTKANDQGFYAGVTVTAYDAVGGSKAVQTKVDGFYTIPTAGLTGPFRIEVTVPAGFTAGPIGKDNQSTVRFVSNANATGVNFGLVNPNDYAQANPTLVTAYQASGSRSQAGNFGAVVSFPYTIDGYQGKNSVAFPTTLAKVSQIGSVNGLASNRVRTNDIVYAAAYVKRFTELGPDGTGAIYAIDRNNANAVTTLINLNNIPAGMIPATDTAAQYSAGIDPRFGVANYPYATTDSKGVSIVNRIGLGDVEISPDGLTLYVTNLNTRELIEIPLNADGTLNTSATLRRTPMPTTFTTGLASFTQTDLRPFAIDIHDGVVYVGTTYTAETSAKNSELRSYVFAFNPGTGKFSSLDQTTNTFTAGTEPVLTAPLNYSRIGGTTSITAQFYNTTTGALRTDIKANATDTTDVGFQAWDNVVGDAVGSVFYNPMPLLTDLDFDRDVMVLGIRDRYGDMIGWYGSGAASVGAGEGDLLRAHPTDSGGFVLESGGTSNGVTNSIGGAGVLRPNGPDGAAFYWSDYYYGIELDDSGEDYGYAHPSTSMGGIYQVPGGTRLASTNMDPRAYSSGGISWFDNATGLRPQNYEIYRDSTDGSFGKANGLGDLEAFENLSPIEIGNFIWLDTDGDGIQDPGDTGLANVDLEFWDLGDDGVVGGSGANADTKLATAKTDANGNYLFSGFTGTNTDSAIFGLNIQPNRAYEVRIPNLVGQAALAGNVLTTTDATDGNPTPDVRDSDLVERSNTGVIRVVTGGPGSIDHTFDAGFKAQSSLLSLGNLIWNDLNNDGKVTAGEPGIDNILVSLHKDLNGDGVIDGTDPLVGSQTTAGGGQYLFVELDPGKYIVSFTPPAGFITSTGQFGNAKSGPYEPGVVSIANNEDHGSLVGTKIQTKSVELFVGGNAANPDDKGTANYRQDFGIFRPYSLGNRVWLDVNNNGKIDTGETGIDGATVRLLDSTGTTTLLTTTTKNGGYYRFDTLTAGDYVVEIDGASVPGLKSSTGSVLATGPYEPAPAVNSQGDSFDYGSISGVNFRSGIVTIGNAVGGDSEPGGELDLGTGDAAIPDLRADLTVDFGFFRPLTLGNRVFIDTNNNGIFDTGDLAPPANVSVNLLDSAGTVLENTTTNAQGFYLFTNLNPGSYFVEIAKSNFATGGSLLGYASSTGGGNGKASGIFEPVAGLTGDDRDNGSTLASTAVRSPLVTLTSDAAPTGEPATPGLTDPANDKNSNLTVDFGFFPILTLGNFVFEDVNNSGQQNGTEPGIANVAVDLILDVNGNNKADDAVLLSTTTNAQGFYQFTNLFEGNYFVRVTAPAGFISSTGTIGSATGTYEPAASPNDKKDQFDDGTTAGTFIISDFVTLAIGNAPLAEPPSSNLTDLATDANSNRTVDFGLFRPVSLGNRVWDDTNNNGLFDAGELGIGNVQVALVEAVGKTTVATTTTDANGYYLFTHLVAGQYFVDLTLPTGYTSSTGGVGGTGPFEPAPAASPQNDLDRRDDGTLVANTILVRSGTITLSADGEPDTETDVGPQSASDPAPNKNSNLTLDFGLFRPLTIGNLVWNDKNNNGQLDSGEPGLGNVTVNLWSDPDGDGVPNAKLTTTVTNPQGSYLFTGLGEGKYIVQVDALTLPTGYWLTSSGKNGSLTGPFEKAPASSDNKDQVDDGSLVNGIVISSTITLTTGAAPTGEPATPGLTDPATDANSNATVDFGFYQPVSIGNLVFFDANNNGVFDPATETGIADVPVRLILDANQNNFPDDGVFLTTTTNAQGGYVFNTLLPGTYFVEIITPVGYFSSTGKNGSATSGPYEPGTATTKDREDHGTRISNLIVRSGAVVLAASGMPTGEPAEGVTDATPDNASNFTIDFGLWQPLSLGNHVFFDADNNGVFDPATETGLANVPVSLFDGLGNLVASTTTGNDGKYLFTNLGAGSYVVEVTTPSGFASSTGKANQFEPAPDPDNNADNDDNGTIVQPGNTTVRSLPVDLTAGEEPTNGDTNLTVDFGFYRTMSLGNLVWNDANNNGVVDTGEAGLANVSVRLYVDADGNGLPDGAAIATQLTDAKGNYLFTGLSPGKYVVETADPTGFVPSSGANGKLTSGPYQPAPNADGDTDNDDNGSLVTGSPGHVRSSTITLSSGQEPSDQGYANLTVDFGYFQPLSLGNLVWNDANNNGQFEIGEKGLSNVPVVLLDGTGTTVVTTQTDANGIYSFPNLVEGTYVVQVTLPTGFTSSTGVLGGNGPFEPALGADNNINNVDDGTIVSGPTVTSGPVIITRGQEPEGTAKSDNLTVDFGAYQSLSLGNQVFFDSNNNGKRDAGEAGIADVNVRLFRDANADGVPDGAALATQKTTSTGHYLFTGLGEGNFVIEVDTPTGLQTSTGKNASPSGPNEPAPNAVSSPVDDDDNGSFVSGVVRSSTVTMIVGSLPTGEPATPGFTDPATDANSNLTVDFGFNRPMAVGDLVFDDRNNNGIRDTGEPGLANVPVRLLDSNGNTLAVTTTDANGGYRFDNVSPGQYLVEIDPLAGYISSTGGVNGSGPFEPAAAPTGTLHNQDVGSKHASGSIRSGTFTLTQDKAPTIEGDTDANTDFTLDFGLFRPLTIGNLVWNDANNNGLIDTGEAGMSNVTVNLWSDPEGDGVPNAKLGTTQTNAQGSYLFTGLGEGKYIVQLDSTSLPTGFITSSGKNASASGPYEPAPNDTTDNNDNGSVRNGLILSGPITLAVGTAPTGEPATPGLADPAVDANSNVTVDFGVYQPLSLGNLVWSDFNNNGLADPGEPGLPNLQVQLFDSKGTLLATTTTNASGNYRFDNLNPNDYYVEVLPGAGVGSSKGANNAYEPGVAANDNTDNDDNGTQPGALGTIVRSSTITLSVGNEPAENGNFNPTLDIGLLATAKVSGFVYIDPNIDGKFVTTTGDKALGGVTVTISGTDAGGNTVPPRTTRTDANGFYQFTELPPGTYTIVETQPTGILVDGIDSIGSLGGTTTNDKHVVTLVPNDNGQNYNFGEIPPANAFGNVYVDTNRNGRPDPGERPIPNVAVTISGTAFAGTPLARPLTAADVPGGALTVFTNGAGRWEFPVLPPGSYTFTQTQPPAFIDAQEQNGDPQTNPVITNDIFSGVVLRPFPIGGPYNFGEIDPNDDPTKRDFLGSTVPGTNTPIVVPDGDRPLLQLPLAPNYTVTSGNVNTPTYVAYGSGPGATPLLRVFDFATGTEKFRQFAYESTFIGGVRVATGDVNGDGVEDIVTSTGPGGGPRIRVFDGNTGNAIVDTFVFESSFRGGVFVATGDVNNDGRADIIVGAEIGGGPRYRAIDGVTGAELMNGFAFDANQRGGVRVAAADFNADGRADIVATTGVGVATRVRVINSANGATLADFAPYESNYTGGVFIAAGDITGDGVPDIAVGADRGGGPRVQVFSGSTFTQVNNFFAFESGFTGGVRLAISDLNSDGRGELILVAGPGGAPRSRILQGPGLTTTLEDFYPFDPEFTGGAYAG